MFGVSFVLNAARGAVWLHLRHAPLLTSTDAPFTVQPPLPSPSANPHPSTDSKNDDGCCPAGNDWLRLPTHVTLPPSPIHGCAMVTVARFQPLQRSLLRLQLKREHKIHPNPEFEAHCVSPSSSDSNGHMRLTLWDPADRGLSRCRSPCRKPQP